VCRQRESKRRHYHGLGPLNAKRFRSTTFALPVDPVSVGYLAGLIDGEGCITRQNGRWRLQVAMTHEPTIRWLGTLGGTVRERSVVGNRQPCWRWILARQADVHACLTALLPVLRVKATQAARALSEIGAEDHFRAKEVA
jgi:hypothetical protein